MSEDLDLMERFRLLAEARFAEPTPVAQLRTTRPVQFVAHRRPTLRVLAVAAVILGAVLVAGLFAVRKPASVERVGTEPGPSTTTSAPSVPPLGGDYPRLVVGRVPEGMATQGCHVEHDAVLCSLTIPATAVPDGVNLAWSQGPMPPGLQDAWDSQDAGAAGAALAMGEGMPTFNQVAGRVILTYGETDRLSGGAFGLPDRVTVFHVLLLEDQVVQIHSEGATAEQLADIIGGLSFSPSNLGFTVAPAALPDGAVVISEGRRRPYWLGDPLDPSQSTPYPGTAVGATYQIGSRSVDVSVIHDVDADKFVSTWTGRVGSKRDTSTAPFIQGGHDGMTATVAFPPNQPPQSTSVALPLDDRTVLVVSGRGNLTDTIEAIARATNTTP